MQPESQETHVCRVVQVALQSLPQYHIQHSLIPAPSESTLEENPGVCSLLPNVEGITSVLCFKKHN